MPAIRPFQGVRFATAGNLSRLLCPPYDIIPPEAAARLRREPHNAVHLELPPSYQAARELWERWLKTGVLRTDERPVLYVCEQVHGRQRRLGVFVDLSLDREASRIVPHERTFSKPKADRLELLKTLSANTSPIFGIVDDPGGRILALLKKAARGAPLAEGKDPAGGRVRLWSLAGTDALVRAMGPRPMLIADGHHRFQVSADFAESVGRDVGCLAYIASEADPGLLLLTTHRVVTPPGALFDRISAACVLKPVASRAALERALYKGRGVRLGLFLNRKRWVATPLPASPRIRRRRTRLGRERGEGRLLPVEWLAGVLDQENSEVAYTHATAEAETLAAKKGGLAVLLPAPSVKEVRAAVARRGLLPQKSTYFFPKVPTGLVFRELN